MSFDIAPILRYWEFISNDMRVSRERVSGNEFLKLVYGAGQITMEIDGRPDGSRPLNMKSYWDMIEKKIKQMKEEGKRYVINDSDFNNLLQEIVLYHARSIAFIKIGDYQKSAKDVKRNIQLIETIFNHIDDPGIKERLKRLKPYFSMAYNKSLVKMSDQKGNGDEALRYARNGKKSLKKKYNLVGKSYEIFCLEKLEDYLLEKYSNSRSRLEKELRFAVEKENFERAAVLRDRLKYISRN